MDDRHFSQLLDRLKLSWKGYRKVRKGIKKRVLRHMQRLGCRNMESYFHVLDYDPQALRELELLVTVSISRFFRDNRLWLVLEDEIIPELIKRGNKELNVWSAGCAHGQEVYSFKILWNRFKEKSDRLPRLKIWATDVNPDYLNKASEGAYRESSLKGIPEEIKSIYFRLSKDRSLYFIYDHLKSDITWETYNLVRQPPPAKKFQIIFLRNNLLTYYQQEIKKPAFLKVISSLDRNGFLIVGTHEKLPIRSHSLSQFKEYQYIFQRIEHLD